MPRECPLAFSSARAAGGVRQDARNVCDWSGKGAHLSRGKLKLRTPERWQSGRMRRFAKPLYGLTPVPRVRIPPSPPYFQLLTVHQISPKISYARGSASLTIFVCACRMSAVAAVPYTFIVV